MNFVRRWMNRRLQAEFARRIRIETIAGRQRFQEEVYRITPPHMVEQAQRAIADFQRSSDALESKTIATFNAEHPV